jgi:DNA-binding NtrC family response regulator
VVITGTLTREMFGADAAEAIYKSRPIPVILYSGHCEPELVVNAEHKHVFIYLVKPIAQEHLAAALKECHCTNPSDPTEGELTMVPIGTASESFDSTPHHELNRPPYRQRPR